MPDLVDRIHSEIAARTRELRPLVDEYERLQAAMAALGSAERPAPQKGHAANTRHARRDRAPGKRHMGEQRKRAPRGHNRDLVLKLVGERPGVTRAELVQATGIHRPTLYATVAHLQKTARLTASDLPGGQVGYVVATSSE